MPWLVSLCIQHVPLISHRSQCPLCNKINWCLYISKPFECAPLNSRYLPVFVSFISFSIANMFKDCTRCGHSGHIWSLNCLAFFCKGQCKESYIPFERRVKCYYPIKRKLQEILFDWKGCSLWSRMEISNFVNIETELNWNCMKAVRLHKREEMGERLPQGH